FLTILAGPEPEPFIDGSGRRELAEAIADPRNPLTWRVMANRLWSVVFDEPLVSTPSNFGKLGMRPTHPALLDYLAVRFREDRSPKKLMREMLSSATFRQ